jgi:putative MATE family efflux protein
VVGGAAPHALTSSRRSSDPAWSSCLLEFAQSSRPPFTMRGGLGGVLCLMGSAAALSPLSLPPRLLVSASAVPSSHAVCLGAGFGKELRRTFCAPTQITRSKGPGAPGAHIVQSSKAVGDGGQEQKDADAALKRGLDREFVGISLPAFVQFAAEPLASLVDTMYLGRLGATALGAAGVAISAQYSVSKLYNDPLLRTSISLVAAGTGKAKAKGLTDSARKEELSQAVTSALLLATLIGIVQASVYTLACGPIIQTMGVSTASEMYAPAVSYLTIKALGTPAATMWLVVNGIFRGLGDTTTPLKWALVFTGLNALLVPFFIFNLGMGCSGAAAGTSLAQYIALAPLLMKLNRTVGIRRDLSGLGKSLEAYVKSGAFMLVRTFGKVLTYTVCAREAALLGTVSAAAYNVVFQLGTATTQICESFAVAAQSLLARELQSADGWRKRVAMRHIVKRAVLAGGVASALLSTATWWKQGQVLAGLTSDASVLGAAAAIMPLVLLTQVSKGLAYPMFSM